MKSTEILLPEDEVLDEYSKTARGIRDALEKKGYEFLGQGVDQSAYLEPKTGLVLKIFGTQYNKGLSKTGKPQFTKDQKMFFAWAKYCMQHKDNPFLPKFYGFESFMFDGNPYLQIRQEHLVSAGDMGGWVASSSNVLTHYSDKVNPTNMTNIVKKQVKKWGEPWFDHFVAKIGKKNIQLLFSTMFELYQIGLQKGWDWDLHRYNVMARKDGTPVIVDPWVV